MPRVDPAVLDRMAAQYQQSISRVHIAAEAAAVDAWYQYDSFQGEDEEGWNATFWAIVLAASTSVSAISRAYLQNQLAYTGYAAPLPSPDLGWLDEDFSNYNLSPMVAARWRVSEGEDGSTAMVYGAQRAEKLLSAVVREAEQQTFEQMVRSQVFEVSWEFEVDDRAPTILFPDSQDRADQLAATQMAEGRNMKRRGRDVKYKRIPQAGACGWCRVVADRLYSVKAKEASPLGAWHTYCRCTWRQVTAQEAAAFTPRYGDGEWRTVIDERFDETETGDE